MASKTCNRPTAQSEDSVPSAFLRQSTLLQNYVPFSAATLWRLVKAGRFPRPIKVTNQITAWRCSDIEDWVKDPEAYIADEPGGQS